MKNTAKELREMRDEISELLVTVGFSRYKQRVNSLTKTGVQIAGVFGASFDVDKGLEIWNKAQRNSGDRLTVSKLVDIEISLKEKFDELISSGRLL